MYFSVNSNRVARSLSSKKQLLLVVLVLFNALQTAQGAEGQEPSLPRLSEAVIKQLTPAYVQKLEKEFKNNICHLQLIRLPDRRAAMGTRKYEVNGQYYYLPEIEYISGPMLIHSLTKTPEEVWPILCQAQNNSPQLKRHHLFLYGYHYPEAARRFFFLYQYARYVLGCYRNGQNLDAELLNTEVSRLYMQVFTDTVVRQQAVPFLPQSR
jgi:hypothetical protein